MVLLVKFQVQCHSVCFFNQYSVFFFISHNENRNIQYEHRYLVSVLLRINHSYFSSLNWRYNKKRYKIQSRFCRLDLGFGMMNGKGMQHNKQQCNIITEYTVLTVYSLAPGQFILLLFFHSVGPYQILYSTHNCVHGLWTA